MGARRQLRRGAILLAATTGLVAAAIVAPSPTSADVASAAAGCLRDVSVVPVLSPQGCDDTTPPETSFGPSAPRVTAGGWINKRSLRVSLRGVHTDADTDPISLECHLSADGAAPTAAQWQECDVDQVFTDLEESDAAAYVLWARAVDDTDSGIRWYDLSRRLTEPVDDVDQTPATLAFGVDTVGPDTTVAGTAPDRYTPGRPVVGTPRPRFVLSSTDAADFRCTLDRRSVPCAAGTTTLPALTPGAKTLRVQAVDAAGNLDPTPAVTEFTVPDNLRAKGAKSGWKRVRSASHLGGDVLRARRKGAELTFVAKRFRELRLIATTGPRAGTIQLKIGSSWHTVSLQNPVRTQADQIQLRDELAPRLSGRIRVRVVSSGRPVALDGVLAR